MRSNAEIRRTRKKVRIELTIAELHEVIWAMQERSKRIVKDGGDYPVRDRDFIGAMYHLTMADES